MGKVIHRGTQQRRYIYQVLERANRPLSPQEILAEAKKAVPNLGIATVYRTVKYFTENGLFEAVELPGEGLRYELSGKHHHHHFHCKRCGKVYEIEGCSGESDISKVPPGFTVEEHLVILYGLCANCQHSSGEELPRQWNRSRGSNPKTSAGEAIEISNTKKILLDSVPHDSFASFPCTGK